ncbi:MAG: CHAP domain-containing protein [Bacteroidota bacterium]
MNYPGYTIKQHDPHKDVVTAIQKQLNAKGCGPIGVDGDYGDNTFNAVLLFQSRFADANGHPLTMDGMIGPVTWSTLFGVATVAPVLTAASPLLTAVLKFAGTQVGIMESPEGSNSGPEVNKYLKSVGLGPGYSWCMSFVYYCFGQASTQLGIANPAYKSGGVIDAWDNTHGKKVLHADAIVNTSLVLPGQIFIISTGGGHGHTGLVEKVTNGLLTTIEGNTNNDGSSNGIGVFRRSARTINSINMGFIQH